MSTLACPYCEKTFTPRNSQQKTCGSDACKKAYRRAYQQSEEYKAYDRARRQTEEHKAYDRAYRQTEEYKARNRAYRRAVRAAEALGIPPLVFAAMKIMSQHQEPNHDTRQRAI